MEEIKKTPPSTHTDIVQSGRTVLFFIGEIQYINLVSDNKNVF